MPRNYMNRQEIFDKVANHLITQKKKSFVSIKNYTNRPSYYDDKGNKIFLLKET